MNTHYNIIDTLCFAFDKETIQDISYNLTEAISNINDCPVFERVERLLSNLQLVTALESSPRSVRYTILECFVFACTEGLVGNKFYQFPTYANVRYKRFDNNVKALRPLVNLK